jgi:hypothetical protein
MCTLKVWNYTNGKVIGSHQEPYSPDSSDICAATLDSSGRRMITSDFKNTILLWAYNSGTIISELKLGSTNSLITHLMFAQINSKDILIRAGWDKVIDLFIEIEPIHFELYRQFRGHSGDISALVGFPNALVSGSVTSEIFCWSLDTTVPLGKYLLSPGTAIECLASIKQSVIVGDSNGFITVLSVPKLTLIQSIQAHGITINHSISALAVDTENNLCYSADTLGYVKQWDIGFGTVLADKTIIRCHNDEITAVVVFARGNFMATCGIDNNVRIWKLPEFQYVGFFSDESHWDLLKSATWVDQRPFETDQKHFLSLSKQGNVTLTRTIIDLPSPPESPGVITEQKNEEVGGLLTYDEFNQLMNDYMNRSNRPRNPPTSLIEQKGNGFTEVVEMPLGSRPLELLESIHKWQSNAVTAESSGRKTAMGLRGRILRMPVKGGQPVRPNVRTKKISFLMETTGFY